MIMIIGITCTVVFVFVSASIFTPHMRDGLWIKRVINKLHKPFGNLLAVLILLHLVLSLKLFYQRPFVVYVLGFLMFICAALAKSTKAFFKDANKGMLIHKLSALAMALLLVAHVTICIASFNQYKANVAAISIETLDVTSIPDGDYSGECDVGYIYAKVDVSVSDGIIENIELIEHRNERGAAGEGVIDEILAKQSVEVDAISGATNSSRVIMKAVENALSGG